MSTHSLPAVDLLIRTGGERRVSDFLLFEAAYAELYFLPIMWPDFNAKALRDAFGFFAGRERRFGLTGEQVHAAAAPQKHSFDPLDSSNSLLSEAASAECLQRRFGAAVGEVFAVVRGVEVKYRRPATGDLFAFGNPDDRTRDSLVAELAERGRTSAAILIDLKDRAGTLTLHGKFEWFLSRVPPPRQ